MTFFLVIDLVLRIFPFFSHNIFRMFTMLNVVYDHFLTRKPSFFILFILSRTSDNTTSQNIGGDQCMGCPPHLKFWGGDRPPSPPRSPPLDQRVMAFFVTASVTTLAITPWDSKPKKCFVASVTCCRCIQVVAWEMFCPSS